MSIYEIALVRSLSTRTMTLVRIVKYGVLILLLLVSVTLLVTPPPDAAHADGYKKLIKRLHVGQSYTEALHDLQNSGIASYAAGGGGTTISLGYVERYGCIKAYMTIYLFDDRNDRLEGIEWEPRYQLFGYWLPQKERSKSISALEER